MCVWVGGTYALVRVCCAVRYEVVLGVRVRGVVCVCVFVLVSLQTSFDLHPAPSALELANLVPDAI